MLTLKLWIYALGGIPLGVWALVQGEPLGATVFLAIGLGSDCALIDKHWAKAPRWVGTTALIAFAVGLLALVALVIRAYVNGD